MDHHSLPLLWDFSFFKNSIYIYWLQNPFPVLLLLDKKYQVLRYINFTLFAGNISNFSQFYLFLQYLFHPHYTYFKNLLPLYWHLSLIVDYLFCLFYIHLKHFEWKSVDPWVFVCVLIIIHIWLFLHIRFFDAESPPHSPIHKYFIIIFIFYWGFFRNLFLYFRK